MVTGDQITGCRHKKTAAALLQLPRAVAFFAGPEGQGAPLRFGDLNLGHEPAQILSSFHRLFVTLGRGQVKPFVGLNEIARNELALEAKPGEQALALGVPLLCCPAEPAQPFLRELADAHSIEVERAQLDLSVRESLQSGLGEPFECLKSIGPDSLMCRTKRRFSHGGHVSVGDGVAGRHRLP